MHNTNHQNSSSPIANIDNINILIIARISLKKKCDLQNCTIMVDNQNNIIVKGLF